MARKSTGLLPLLLEFARYLLVGGLAFLLDFGVLVLLNTALPDLSGMRLYIATAAGFIAGLVFNYALSVLFVFRLSSRPDAGRSVTDFFVFALVGLAGLGLTELGMYAGTSLMRLDYRLVKVAVTCLVLMWNYLGRKILIFR